VHIGCGEDAVAAQVEVNHFMPSVGDEIFRHAVVQEESSNTHIFKETVEIFYAFVSADEGWRTKDDSSKHNENYGFKLSCIVNSYKL